MRMDNSYSIFYCKCKNQKFKIHLNEVDEQNSSYKTGRFNTKIIGFLSVKRI